MVVESTASPMGSLAVSVTTQEPPSSFTVRTMEMGMLWGPMVMVPA